MAFAYKLRRRAAASPRAVARRSAAARQARIHKLVVAFVSEIRRRADAAGAASGLLAAAGLKRVASMPRPLTGFDVGVDSDLALVYRNELGQKSNVHPARAPDAHIPLGCALASDGSVCLPLSPPMDSAFELCADASGAMCYYDRDLGSAQWEPPPGSTPLRTRLLSQPAVGAPDSLAVDTTCFTQPPPPFPPGLSFGTLFRSSWVALYDDGNNTVRLFNSETGAVRLAPWICLRTDAGRVYFVNLLTNHTRWLPPTRWMQG